MFDKSQRQSEPKAAFANALFRTLAGLSRRFATRGYVSGSWGYIAACREKPLHRANLEQFAQVIERFLADELFDMLYVSKENDRYGGLMLVSVHGPPRMSVTFYAKRQAKELSEFESAMTAAGYTAEVNSSGYNGGIGEQHRSTRLNYPLAETVSGITSMVDLALAQIQPSHKTGYYVSGSRFCDGPGGRKGIGFVGEHDPLIDLFEIQPD